MNQRIWSIALLAAIMATNISIATASDSGSGGDETKTLPKELSVDLAGGVKMELVLIPAGKFSMGTPGVKGEFQKGAPPPKDANEKPRHQVSITTPFYLGKYLVTQEQWQAVVGGNPSHFQRPKNPVERVSWHDCQDSFLVNLNAQAPQPGRKFTLPTEAQWEYACRAGSNARYSFGNDESSLGDYAWYSANSNESTHPVGEKKPNAWGLYDMHGNVGEWCQDAYNTRYYVTGPKVDPPGPAPMTSNSDRIFRGGSALGPADACRSAYRVHAPPNGRFSIVGLRVALVPAEMAAVESAGTPTAEAEKTQAAKPKARQAVRLPKDTKPDVRFVFDFSELNLHSGDPKKEAALKAACDRFARYTRDEVYPILREITGVYVGKHFKDVSYTIKPVGTMGGCALDNHIKLDQRYSVDLDPPCDVHELIHVINFASGALHGSVDHIWHGALINAVEVRLGMRPAPGRDPAWRNQMIATYKPSVDKLEAEPNGFYSPNFRSAILTVAVTFVCHAYGEEAIGRLYRSTINPHPKGKPSQRMVALWGRQANQVQALVETLERDYKVTFDERTRTAIGW